MKSQISLGRIFGINVGLHYSWPLIAVLVAFSLASGYRLDHPQWAGGIVASLAITSAILFFVSLLLHHLVQTRLRRIEIFKRRFQIIRGRT